MTGLALGDVCSAKISSLNSSVDTQRKKMSRLNSYWAAETTVGLLHQEVPGTKVLHSNIFNEAFPSQPLKPGEIYPFASIIFKNIKYVTAGRLQNTCTTLQ